MKGKILFIICLVLTLIAVSPFSFSATTKNELAVRADLTTIDEPMQDRPFSATALILGRCRDYEDHLAAALSVKQMYHLEKTDGENKPKPIGSFFIDKNGQKSVCFDDLAILPFVEKNIHGEKVSINGFITAGSVYELEYSEIILVDTMELIKIILNNNI